MRLRTSVGHRDSVIRWSLVIGIWSFASGCLTVLVLAALLSCRPGAKQPSPEDGQTARVRKQRLIVGRDTVLIEVAATEEMRTVGLMYRTVMAENEGMLFVFEAEGIYPFWMKNTELPLSIAFIDRSGAIVDIQDMAPHDEITHHAPSVPVLYALEMNQGWFRTHQVNAGDKVQFPGDTMPHRVPSSPGRPQ